MRCIAASNKIVLFRSINEKHKKVVDDRRLVRVWAQNLQKKELNTVSFYRVHPAFSAVLSSVRSLACYWNKNRTKEKRNIYYYRRVLFCMVDLLLRTRRRRKEEIERAQQQQQQRKERKVCAAKKHRLATS